MVNDFSNRKLNILFASHTFMGGPFVVGSHHLARELSKKGHRVLHLSSPITPLHILKLKDPIEKSKIITWWKSKKLNENKSDILDFVPMTLIPWRVVEKFENFSNLKPIKTTFPNIRKIMTEYFQGEDIDVLLIDQPKLIGIEEIVKPKILIYRPTDLYSKMDNNPLIDLLEKELMSKANGLIATSNIVRETVLRFNPKIPSLTLENGVEFDRFSNVDADITFPISLEQIPLPRAIYMGAIDQRLDMEALKFLGQKIPNLSIVVIGPYSTKDKEMFQKNDNIYLLGPRKYDELPNFLKNCQIGLLPLSKHKANQGRSPMKLYEYAAAGLPVLVPETIELKRRSQDRFIYFYNDLDTMVDVARELINNPVEKEKIKSAAYQYSWEKRVETLLEFTGGIYENSHKLR